MDLFFDWKFLLAVSVYGAATILWIHILKSMPLSSAYPLAMGATIALTSLLGIAIFNESLTLVKALGIGLVILAMVALSR
jgi:undecaprenyl phosphate-alpha-L-ara4N flippase subunit ArnE